MMQVDTGTPAGAPKPAPCQTQRSSLRTRSSQRPPLSRLKWFLALNLFPTSRVCA